MSFADSTSAVDPLVHARQGKGAVSGPPGAREPSLSRLAPGVPAKGFWPVAGRREG